MTCCNPLLGIGSQSNCSANNAAVIIAAIIAFILINILDDETSNCVGQVFSSIGELMQLGSLGNGLNNINNGANRCNYY